MGEGRGKTVGCFALMALGMELHGLGNGLGPEDTWVGMWDGV